MQTLNHIPLSLCHRKEAFDLFSGKKTKSVCACVDARAHTHTIKIEICSVGKVGGKANMENKNEILIHIPIDLKLRRERKEKETFRVALGEWQGFSSQMLVTQCSAFPSVLTRSNPT